MGTAFRRITGLVPAILATAATAAVIAGCGKKTDAAASGAYQTATVERRDVIVQVSASGVIEPIRIIEIKSKASGEILRLPVETGDFVRAGALLAQVDTTDVSATLRQAQADLQVARARVTITQRQRQRSDDLLARGMISDDDHDQAVLEYTTARANLVKSETALEQARERLRDTVVRAPSAGTVLSKNVEEGQIIASATREVTGGTTLMKMADLSRVQVRALVDETDLGKVHAGQQVDVAVDTYPNRRFEGEILKIEPEAVNEQSITFFPVLVQIDNAEGILKPGMNAEVEVHILRRDGVLALPSDVLKTPRTAAATAPLLGLDPDSVRMVIEAAMRAPRGEGAPQVAEGTPDVTPRPAPSTRPAQADRQAVDRQPEARSERRPGSGDRDGIDAGRRGDRGGFRPEGRGDTSGGGEDRRERWLRRFGGDTAAAREAARRFRERRAAEDGGMPGMDRSGQGDASARPNMAGARDDRARSGGGSARGGTESGRSWGGAGRSGRGGFGGDGMFSGVSIAFVRTGTKIAPVVVKTGAASWDYTEIVSGLAEGAEVIVPPSAALAQNSEEARERARRMSGGGVLGRAAGGRSGGGGGR